MSHPLPPLSPYAMHSSSTTTAFTQPMHGYPNSLSPSVSQHLPPPFHPHYPQYPYPLHFPQPNSSPYSFGATSYSSNGMRQLSSSKLPGRPYHTVPHRPLISNNTNNNGVVTSNPTASTFGCIPESLHYPLNMQAAATSSPVCPSHSTDAAWIGLPGRPIICLVECLLDAAAMAVESDIRLGEKQQSINQSYCESAVSDPLESASFYLCLTMKVCLFALFQQRRLCVSVNRLLACQAQEARLIAWLNTMPKDAPTLMAVCETMAHLLGPPTLSRLTPRPDPVYMSNSSNLGHAVPTPAWWWWSALGPVTHSDSYPVHGAAHFVLDYILEAQGHNASPVIHNFWPVINASTSSANTGSSSSCTPCPLSMGTTGSAIRVDDLLFAVLTRAMRFSVLEPVSDSIGLVFMNSRPPQLHSNSTSVPPPPPIHHLYNTSNHYHHPPPTCQSPSSVASRSASYPNRFWTLGSGIPDAESALALNIEVNNERNPVDVTIPSNLEVTVESHTHALPSNPPNGFHYSSGSSTQPRLFETERSILSAPTTFPYPPFPSAFVAAVQACIKLLDIPYTQTASCMPIPPVLSTPFCTNSRTSLSPIACLSETHLSQSLHHSTPPLASQSLPSPTPQLGSIFSNPNTPVRRCLEGMELQQTHLAIALLRLSKSSVFRLDQLVQIFDRHIHSATSLLAISQQIFAEAVGLEPVLTGVGKYDSIPLFTPDLFAGFSRGMHQFGSTAPSTSSITAGAYSPDRINLICTAYHLALLVVLRTLTRTVHWRRREMLAWVVSTALHVGPSACLYLVTNWSTYVSPREAVNWLAPALISVIGKSESGLPDLIGQHQSDGKLGNPNARKSSGLTGVHGSARLTDSITCTELDTSASPSSLTVLCNSNLSDGAAGMEHHHRHGRTHMPDEFSAVFTPPTSTSSSSAWPTHSWYNLSPTLLSSRHANSITVAAQMLGSAVPYSTSATEHILSAVRQMALQAASKDPVNCALAALTLAERNASAFVAVYQLVLHSAESGSLGPVQLFSLARYMDSRGWAWRAFPFALHATRLFVLSTMQDNHPVATDVLWACSLAHRLGPSALQELLQHVIRNIHCPTVLTEILHRCRITPSGVGSSVLVPPQTNSVNCALHPEVTVTSGRTTCPGAYNHASLYQSMASGPSSTLTTCPTIPPNSGHAKLLSLDRPPLKALLEATINAFVTATHTRLANISPRQYAEFVDFLTRARDTFHLLRPDGPSQFRSLVECLRQTYRGKRKLVLLLSERFG